MSNTELLTKPVHAFVLDGGFSTQIAHHVCTTPDGDPLWSARFLKTNPQDVIKTHLDFLRAGSDIIETNTYQASVEGFVKHLNLTPEESYQLIKQAVGFAKTARDLYVKEREESKLPVRIPLIAGSVGPYGAYLHDSSEYTGAYADRTSKETIRDWHQTRIKALVEAGVDILAIETIPCQKEAEVIVELLKEYPEMKAWLSFSCKDDHSLAHGESFRDAANKCWDLNPEQLLAIGVNCCSPKIVAKLIKEVNKDRQTAIPFVTYPNSGEKYDSELGWIEKDKCESLHSFVSEWLDLGVRFIGGCCRTHDVDITRIRTEVDLWLAKRKTE